MHGDRFVVQCYRMLNDAPCKEMELLFQNSCIFLCFYSHKPRLTDTRKKAFKWRRQVVGEGGGVGMAGGSLGETGPEGTPSLGTDTGRWSADCASDRVSGRTEWSEPTTELLRTTERSAEQRVTGGNSIYTLSTLTKNVHSITLQVKMQRHDLFSKGTL